MRKLGRPYTTVWLAFILAGYLGLGTLYAVDTPHWQVPDEPTHYNYVRYLAEGRGLPVLQAGDYNQDYLERAKSERFPASMPLDAVRYEFHQPPLYYALAAPVYLATGGSLVALRLFSVVLGGALVLVAFLLVREVAPDSPVLALGTAAFVAFIPQHMAMMAGVNNDSLAELLLAAVMWQTVRNIKFQISNLKSQVSDRRWLGVGVLMGLGLLTKATVYIMLPLVVLALLFAYGSQRPPRDRMGLAGQAAWAVGPALLLGVPWWVRNIFTYGWPDWMGLARHDLVVAGQPTSADWIARNGLLGYARDCALTTFHSFWGQFGWMGVPMNGRYYTALGILSLVAFSGVAWLSFRNFKFQNALADLKSRVWYLKFDLCYLIFALWVLFACAGYLWYLTKYVQFQGRYLFPALIPIGLAFTAGLRQWARLLPRLWREPALGLTFAALAALDLVALFRVIIPALTP